MDTTEFAAVIETLRPVILNACKRVHSACGSDLCDPADLVQEAHLRLWEQRDKLALARYPKAWAYRVSHNAARNSVRQQRRQARIPFADLNQFAGYAA